MGQPIPFTYSADSLNAARGLHTEVPPAVLAVSVYREIGRRRRLSLPLWHRQRRHAPVPGC
jgi:hypothetical protein